MKLALFIVFSFLSFTSLAQQNIPEFPPQDVTNQMDWSQMLNQLEIQLPQLPSKVDDPNRPSWAVPQDSSNLEGNWKTQEGYFVTRSPWGLWNNYHDISKGYLTGKDSSMLGDYELIDLLKMKDGSKVTTAEDWWSKKRPEIATDVMNALYGFFPADSVLPAVTFSVKTNTGGIGQFAYIEKEITGTIDTSRYPEVRDVPVISATLRTPAEATGPVPVLLSFGGFGNRLEADWQVTAPQGWGVCTFNPNALQPDNGRGLTSYLIGLVNKGNWRKPTDWGSIGAWSWGVSRLVDYFESDDQVNAEAVALTGHSRYGKATLYAMAMEPRIAMGFPSDAGALGTSVNRRHMGQDLEHASWPNEYHWMAGNFFKWAGEKTPGQYLPRKIEDCPVDSYSLLAMCAPRPVLINGGNQSTWTDPYGEYLTALYASPVYQLLGEKGIVMNDPTPLVDKGYIDGTIAYRYHNGGHTYFQEWPSFFEMSNRYIKAPMLDVMPRFSVINSKGGNMMTTILSNEKWSISMEPDWLSLDQTSGEGEGTVQLTAKKNNKKEGRSQMITITSDGREMSFMVSQSSSKSELTLGMTELTLDKDPMGLSVISNTAWMVSTDVDWILLPQPSGTNNQTIKIQTTNNPKVEQRTATLKVFAHGLDTLSVQVTQLEGDPTLRASTTALRLDGEEGSSAGFWAFTNTSWTVECSTDWLSTSAPGAGEGFNRMTVKAKANNTGQSRKGTVKIVIPNLDPHVIEITQEAP